MFSRVYLVSSRHVTLHGRDMQRSKDCCLPCGTIHNADVVVLIDDVVGAIIDCWQEVNDNVIHAHISQYTFIDACRYDTTTPIDTWVDVTQIYEPVPYLASPGCIRIVPPYKP